MEFVGASEGFACGSGWDSMGTLELYWFHHISWTILLYFVHWNLWDLHIPAPWSNGRSTPKLTSLLCIYKYMVHSLFYDSFIYLSMYGFDIISATNCSIYNYIYMFILYSICYYIINWYWININCNYIRLYHLFKLWTYHPEQGVLFWTFRWNTTKQLLQCNRDPKHVSKFRE